MKKITFVTLIITTALFATACASKSNKSQAAKQGQTTENTEKKALISDSSLSYTPSVNHSYLTEENVGENISVKGKIVQKGNSFSLIENEASKSRVTFILTFENEAVKNKVAAKVNTIATLSGKLTAASSTWTKEIKVLDVE